MLLSQTISLQCSCSCGFIMDRVGLISPNLLRVDHKKSSICNVNIFVTLILKSYS